MSTVHRPIGGANAFGFQPKVKEVMDTLRTFHSAINGINSYEWTLNEECYEHHVGFKRSGRTKILLDGVPEKTGKKYRNLFVKAVEQANKAAKLFGINSNSVAQQPMRARANIVTPSIRDYLALRGKSRCPDQGVSLKQDPQCLKSPSKLGTHLLTHCNRDERLSRSKELIPGIEPRPVVWKHETLPLDH
ncbi:hypothetical protein TNCV_50321 [Trichonephila clavipes]|nr:hypothetical protein TNCV_50321 [Trichonephila clavipes]